MSATLVVFGGAAAGLVTNVLAVHLVLRVLIPLRKEQLARAMGEQVAKKLLTPEALAEEAIAFMKGMLSDPELVRRGRVWLARAMKDHLPAPIDMFRPELMPGLRARVTADMARVPVSVAVEALVDAWFSDPKNRGVAALILIGIMKEHRDEVVEIMQRGFKRYAKKVEIGAFGIDLVEAMEILDWDDFSEALEEHLDSARGMETALGIVARIPRAMRPYFDELAGAEWISETLVEATGATVDLAEAMPASQVAELISHGVASDELLHDVRYALLPNLKGDLAAWFRRALPEEMVAERVTRAMRAMPDRHVQALATGVGLRYAPLLHLLGGALGALSGLFHAAVAR